MKKLFFFIIVACTLPVSAQQGFTNIENFAAGDQVTYAEVTVDSIDPGPAGKNKKWNFSFLKESKEVSQVIRTSGDAAVYSGKQIKADLVECNTDSSYVYLKKTNDTLYMTEYYDAVRKFDLVYDAPVPFIAWPVTYGQRFESKASRHYEVMGMQFKGTGSVVTEADATGKLTVGGKTYDDVIRVKFTQTYMDKDQTYGTMSVVQSTSYTWFDREHKHAVLKIDIMSVSSSMYKSKEYSVRYIKF